MWRAGPHRRDWTSCSGSDFLERRVGESRLDERFAAPRTRQAAASLAHERSRQLLLLARQLRGLDIGQHDRIVGKQILWRERVPARRAHSCATATPECSRYRRPVRSCPLRTIESTSSPGSAAQARFRKLCSNPGAPSTNSTCRGRAGGCTSTLRVLFSGTSSPASHRHVDGIHHGRSACGRHLEDRVHRDAVASRRNAPHFDRLPVLEQLQGDRLACRCRD